MIGKARKIGQIWSLEFFRFLAVGALNTLVGYALYALFIFLGLHYSLAVLFATILGVLFNFKTYGVLVFRNPANGLILRFVLVYAFTYGLNLALLKILTRTGMSTYLAGGLIAFPVALIAYGLQKKFVYPRGQEVRRAGAHRI